MSTPAVHTGRPDWDDYFLDIAKAVAKRADCTRRQVGCVIVGTDRRIISTGYNGLAAGRPGCASEGACPRGRLSYDEVPLDLAYDHGKGLCQAIHAEANALLYATSSVRGATAYLTHPPCPTCRNLLEGAGVYGYHY